MTFILEVLANPIVLIVLASSVMAIVGLMLGVYVSQPRKDQVIQFSPETGRGIQYDVQEQDEIRVRCKAVMNTPPQRFMKKPLQNAYNIVRKGVLFGKLQNYALWLGRVGTAYTFPMSNPKEATTLEHTLQTLLEPENYDKLSPIYKKRIEEAEIGVIVEFPQVPLTPPGLKPLNSDDTRKQSLEELIKALVQGVHNIASGGKGSILQTIFILGTGVGIGFVLAFFLKVGGTTVVQQSGTKTTSLLAELIYR